MAPVILESGNRNMLFPKEPGQSGTAIPASSLVTSPPIPTSIKVAQKAVRVMDSTPRSAVELPPEVVAAPRAARAMQPSTNVDADTTTPEAVASSGTSTAPSTSRSITPAIAPDISAHRNLAELREAATLPARIRIRTSRKKSSHGGASMKGRRQI